MNGISQPSQDASLLVLVECGEAPGGTKLPISTGAAERRRRPLDAFVFETESSARLTFDTESALWLGLKKWIFVPKYGIHGRKIVFAIVGGRNGSANHA